MELVKDINYSERYEVNGHIYEFHITTVADQEWVNDMMNEQLKLQPNMPESIEDARRSRLYITRCVKLIEIKDGTEKAFDIALHYVDRLPIQEVNALVEFMNTVNAIKKKSLPLPKRNSPEHTGS